MKNLIINLIRKFGRVSNPIVTFDIREELQRMATRSTAIFVKQEMASVHSVDTRFGVHDVAMEHVHEDGLIMEFGVFSGLTTNYIAKSFADRVVDGFDSFKGLPESWYDGLDKGHFAVDALPKVLSNVILHEGWFDKSIPLFLSKNPTANSIAYLHVDCDLYSSTKTVFDCLKHLFIDGTIIVFDEYFNYDGWESGEHLAFQEFLKEGNFSVEWLSYNYKGTQVAARLIKIK